MSVDVLQTNAPKPYLRGMKKVMLFSFLAIVLVFTSCKREEQLRVDSVIGVYDCYADCYLTDLVTQGTPTHTMDTALLYVTRPYDDENGFIALMGQEVHLEQDLTFRKSVTNYSLIGKFEGSSLTFDIDFVDTDAETRSECGYTCTKK
jgi:hypothetical protein